jgi:hypothetical protein
VSAAVPPCEEEYLDLRAVVHALMRVLVEVKGRFLGAIDCDDAVELVFDSGELVTVYLKGLRAGCVAFGAVHDPQKYFRGYTDGDEERWLW